MNELIPVGKLKGKPLAALANEPDYADWLTKQDWFRQKYPLHYNIIINNFVEPQETPEHNRLQAKFLKDLMIESLVRTCGTIPSQIEVVVLSKHFESKGWDLVAEIQTREFSLPLKELNRKYSFNLTKSSEIESHQGWGDPPLRCAVDHNSIAWRMESVSMRCANMCGRFSMGVEFKPQMGDDYPAVLRQVKRSGEVDRRILVVGEYTGAAVAVADVKEMFALDKVQIVLEDEISESLESI